ncbi:YunG family protein [Streptomyces griseorubiginosus]|uniref:YunG family protein n=1 Tax=Streptomyces griseorubiginosus TaxID=67304 RepID=UPI0036EA911E
MTPLLLTDIERAVRSSWSAETCTPEFRSRWSPDNPARDQCGVTAMVLNDLLGGELIRGEVHVNGERVDYHWWNRLGMGLEIDLTREQFGPEETVTGGVVIPRPPVTEWRRLREEYELLRSGVRAGSVGALTAGQAASQQVSDGAARPGSRM